MVVVVGSGLVVGMDDELDDGLKWRGRISDNDEDSEDEFGLYAERLNRPYDDLADDRDEYDDGDEYDEYDEDDPLGGLVTIGNLHAEEAAEDDEADGDGDGRAGRESEPEDFLKQLEELIERDMPKVKITDEYQKVLDAVDASDGGLVGDVGGGCAGGAARKGSVVMVDAEGGEAAAPGDTAMRMRDGDDGDDGDNDDDGDDDDDAVPDLGSVLGGKQVDREAETLAELVEGLVVDEEAERERQRRGKFFDDDDANE